MGFLSRLFQGSDLARAQSAAEAARERAEEEGRTFERWLASLHAEDRTTKAAAQNHLGAASAAAAKNDLPGMQEAREQYELARAAYCKGRAVLANSHPREAAVLLLADAAAAAAEVRDPEDRAVRAATVAELQANCGDFRGARATLQTVTEPPDRASAERALVIARAAAGGLDPAGLLREIEASQADDWNQDEVLLAVVEQRCRRGDRAGAEAMLAPIEDPELKGRGWRALAASEARQGRLDEARTLAERIEDPHWAGVARCDLALAQATSGDLEGALATAQGIEDESARETALAGLAAANVDAGNEAHAAVLLESITDEHARNDALTWIAEERARKGNFEGALAALDALGDQLMRAQELVALAERAQAAGRQEIAADLLQRGLESAEALTSGRGFSPAWLARFLVDARARLNEFDGAEAAVHAIGEERERAELLGSLAFAVARHPSGGLAALDGLLERHQGVMERIAILMRGAQGLLARAEGNAAAKGSTAARPSASPETT